MLVSGRKTKGVWPLPAGSSSSSMPIWSRLLLGLHIWLLVSLAIRNLGSDFAPDPGAIFGNLLRTWVVTGLRFAPMPGRGLAAGFFMATGRRSRVFTRAFLGFALALGATAGESIGSHSRSARAGETIGMASAVAAAASMILAVIRRFISTVLFHLTRW